MLMFIFFLLIQTWHVTFRIYRNRCFLVALCRLRVKRANLEVATSYFQCCGYFRCPWVSFVTTDDFSVMLTKITSRIGVSWTRCLPFWFWPILILKWPYYQKKVNQITSNHTTLWNLASPILEVFCRISLDVIFPWTKPTGILALYETNLMTWLTLAISVCTVSFNPKAFCYLYSYSLCKGRTSFCMVLISRKLCRSLFLFLAGFTSLS